MNARDIKIEVWDALELCQDKAVPFVINELKSNLGDREADEFLRNWLGIGDQIEIQLDLSLGLKLFCDQFSDYFRNSVICEDSVDLAHKVRKVRNSFSHAGTFSLDMAQHALKDVEDFLKCIGEVDGSKEIFGRRARLVKLLASQLQASDDRVEPLDDVANSAWLDELDPPDIRQILDFDIAVDEVVPLDEDIKRESVQNTVQNEHIEVPPSPDNFDAEQENTYYENPPGPHYDVRSAIPDFSSAKGTFLVELEKIRLEQEAFLSLYPEEKSISNKRTIEGEHSGYGGFVRWQERRLYFITTNRSKERNLFETQARFGCPDRWQYYFVGTSLLWLFSIWIIYQLVFSLCRYNGAVAFGVSVIIGTILAPLFCRLSGPPESSRRSGFVVLAFVVPLLSFLIVPIWYVSVGPNDLVGRQLREAESTNSTMRVYLENRGMYLPIGGAELFTAFYWQGVGESRSQNDLRSAETIFEDMSRNGMKSVKASLLHQSVQKYLSTNNDLDLFNLSYPYLHGSAGISIRLWDSMKKSKLSYLQQLKILHPSDKDIQFLESGK